MYICCKFAPPIKNEVAMIYTQQRRKAMNKATRALFPDIQFRENLETSPLMECETLPKDATLVTDAREFFRNVHEHCSHVNEMGTIVQDSDKAMPVFIRSVELTGKNGYSTRIYYRVNYVSPTEDSQKKALEYIADGKLYAVMQKDTCNP